MPLQATLEINRDIEVNGNYHVVVKGKGYLQASRNANVVVRVRGCDQWFDDKLFTFPEPGESRVGVDADGTFTIAKSVPGSKLNEDWGDDEIFAIVSVTGFGDVRTNEVKGNF